MEMKDEVLSSVGAQKTDTSGPQVSDVEGALFYWEYDQMDVDAVCRPGIYAPFSPTAFNNFEVGGSAENPIPLHEEKDKENSPPTTRVSERQTGSLVLLRNRPI